MMNGIHTTGKKAGTYVIGATLLKYYDHDRELMKITVIFNYQPERGEYIFATPDQILLLLLQRCNQL